MASSESRLVPTLRRAVLTLAGGAAVGYLLVAAFVYFKQETLIFRPSPLPAAHRFQIADVEEVTIPVNGAALSALHFKLPDPKGVVFFLHGNAGNLETWMTSVEFYRRVNYDLFMLDYRGFGKSTGTVSSESQLHDDVKAAWAAVAPRYAGKKIAIYGRSLGTGLALKLARDVQPDITILVSPYSSLADMASEIYPWLPGFINRYPMRSDEWLPGIRKPVVIAHGDRDTLIPLAHGKRLSGMSTMTELLVIDGAGHNDIHKFPAYLEGLARRLEKL